MNECTASLPRSSLKNSSDKTILQIRRDLGRAPGYMEHIQTIYKLWAEASGLEGTWEEKHWNSGDNVV